MKQPHKHAELIKAWADGAEIEWRAGKDCDWLCFHRDARWYEAYEYRIKPEPKPDVVRYADVTGMTMHLYSIIKDECSNLKLTFDGETGNLKSAEVLQ